jgi:hypothetical protein
MMTNRAAHAVLMVSLGVVIGFRMQLMILNTSEYRTPRVAKSREGRVKKRKDSDEDGWRTVHTYVAATREEDTAYAHAHSALFLNQMGKNLRQQHQWYSQIGQDEIVWFLLNALDRRTAIFLFGRGGK